MKNTIQRPKGTQDVSPSQVHVWHHLESLLRDTARRYGYIEARFPTFEHTELFVRGVGDTTDVVQKEMYTFEDKGGRSISLRPEGTASTVRAYLENNEAQNGAPYKAYYIAPNFRYEKPQAGRYREHHQFGVECFGAQDYLADAEVICLASDYIRALQIGVTLKLNSIGCPACRPAFHQALRDYFTGRRDELCPTCQTRLDKNPLRILDCKSPVCRQIAQGAPRSVDYLCPECGEHFSGLQSVLTCLGVPFELDAGLVRGLDYYTKTVFEFVATGLGAQDTVCGGGRYDGLIAELGGPATPAVGFGSGMERLILSAQASGFEFPPAPATDVFLAYADPAGLEQAVKTAHALRALGLSAELDLCRRGLKGQMKQANRVGARFTGILGQAEVDSATVSLKNMATGEQVSVPLDPRSIAEAIR